MQKKSLLQFWLLLCLMIAGATHAWAAEIIWTASEAGYSNSEALTTVALDDYITATFDQGTNSNAPKYYTTGTAVRCYGGNTFTISSETATITKIELTFGSSDGSNAITTNVDTYSDGTWEGSAQSIKFTIGGSSGNRRIAGIAVTYTTGGDPSDTRKEMKIIFDDSELNNNIYGNHELGNLRVKILDKEDNDITWGEGLNEYDFYWTCEGVAFFTQEDTELGTTDHPFKGFSKEVASYETGKGIFTIHFDGDNYYKPAEATYEFDIVNIPYHTVSWYINGTLDTDAFEVVNEGDAITMHANPEAIDGKVFVGWTTEQINGVTDTAPELLSSATMGDSNIDFYAVFADVTGGAAVTDVLDREFTGVTGTSYEAWNSKKGDSGAVYAGQSAGGNSSIQLRSDNNNSGVVTTTSAGKVSKVAVEWNSATNNARVLNVYGSNTAYTLATELYSESTQGTLLGTFKKSDGDKQELTIKDDYAYVGVRSASGALYLASLSITWGGATYSGYCTTVAADTREEAGISFKEATVTKEIVDNYTGQALTNSNLLEVTWTSSNEDVATVENGTVTVKAVGQTTITATFAGNEDYKAGSASYTLIIQDSREEITPSFAEASVSVNVNETVNAPALNGNTGEAAVSYESSDPTIATVNEQGVVTGVADGEATITATIAATNQYQGATATFTVTVIDPNKKGTQTNPYTVAEAIDAIVNNGDVTDVYATGIVSQIVTAYNSQYGNISYNISADGTTDGAQLQAYRGLGINGNKFTSADDIQVGDQVVVYGNLILYNSKVYEFEQGNQLVTLSRKATPTLAFEQESYTVEKEAALTITATSDVEGVNIVYSSSDTDVADIDAETGEVHAKAAGTTIITATVAETEDYKGATASVELTVTDSSIPVVYHDIHFYVAGQEYGEGASIEDGKTLTFPEDPTVEDYAFAGWSTTNDVTAPEFVTNATVVNNNMNLYAMFVAKAGVKYRKVTATEDITNGEYLIVYEKERLAFNGALETLDAVGNTVEVEINNGVIASTQEVDAATFTIDATNGTIKSASGNYIGQSSDANGMGTSASAEAYTNTISINDEGEAVIVSGKAHLRYNSTSGQTRFRYYKSSTYSSQKAIALYKKVTGTPIYFDGTIVDEVALSDAQDYTATTATVTKKVTLTRTVKANTWSSFVVPFDMAKPEGEGVKLKELSSSEIKEDGTVRLNFTDATAIEAGKPYMMRSAEAISKFTAEDAVVLPAAQKQDAATAYVDMIGTYVATSIPTGDYFFSNNVFKYVGAIAVNTKGFRAYFNLHDVPAAEGEARIVAFGLDDETTGIDELKQNAESRCST